MYVWVLQELIISTNLNSTQETCLHIFLYQEAADYMYICTYKTDKIPLLGFLGFFIKALMNESNTEGST